MTDLRTDADLLRRLKEASRANLSAYEIKQQKISFILGSLGEQSDVTREKVEEVLHKMDGEAA